LENKETSERDLKKTKIEETPNSDCVKTTTTTTTTSPKKKIDFEQYSIPKPKGFQGFKGFPKK